LHQLGCSFIGTFFTYFLALCIFLFFLPQSGKKMQSGKKNKKMPIKDAST